MATKTLPRCSTPQCPAVLSDALLIQAAATATISSSWITCTDDVVVGGWDEVLLHLDYVKGSETTVEVRLLGSNDNGTTWRPLLLKNTVSSGVSDLTIDRHSLTPANFAASDSGIVPPISVRNIALLRCQFRGQGGSAPGTLAVSISGGLVKTS